MHLDLGHVGVFRGLAAAARLPQTLENELFEALQRKARSQVESLLATGDIPAASRAMLAALIDLNGGAETLERARQVLTTAPREVHAALDNLASVAGSLVHPQLPVYFDLAELRGYRYYTGVVFSAFVPGQGQAVAQGGRYDGIGQAFGRARAATGFSTDLRRLLRLLPAATTTGGGVLAPWPDSAELDAAIQKLRDAGERVVTLLPGASGTARELGCDRELVQQKGQWTVKTV